MTHTGTAPRTPSRMPTHPVPGHPRRVPSIRLSVLTAALTLPLMASTPPDRPSATDGGRNVTVALFTTRDLRSVVVTPLAADAWTAACATCNHVPLTAPLLPHAGDTYAGGTLRIADTADPTASRTATGLWHVRLDTHGTQVILTLPSERYVAAVLAAEAAPAEPSQSLRALAIVARTFALNGPHFQAAPGQLPADLCDSTQCQALRLAPVPPAIADAVSATTGETLWFQGTRAQVFFSQHCGGITEDAVALWPPETHGEPPHAAPYLRSHADPYCLRTGAAAWHATISLADLNTIARQQNWHLPTSVAAVTIAERTPSGRARLLTFRSADGRQSAVSAGALRLAVGRALGWNRIRSDLYDLALRNGSLVFDGRGHGHGAGLCQAGAMQMAKDGRDARTILAFYFPGTHLGISPQDDGWQDEQLGPIHIRSTAPLLADTRTAIERAWHLALTRFPVANPTPPAIVFAPTTELFRQLTAQPGWDLASTRGTTITLQPATVFQRTGASQADTLLHECLHVLIEAEATDRAPLWLREGLPEVLAGDQVSAAALPKRPLLAGGRIGTPATLAHDAALDRKLQQPATAAEAIAAHRLAAARVRPILRRYGLPAARAWLSTGVPATEIPNK